jgi:hypothetical protein
MDRFATVREWPTRRKGATARLVRSLLKEANVGWSGSGQLRLVLLILISTIPEVFVGPRTDIEEVEAPMG